MQQIARGTEVDFIELLLGEASAVLDFQFEEPTRDSMVELGRHLAARNQSLVILADEFDQPYLKTFHIPEGATEVAFSDRIRIPLRPFPGVMGVAPDTDEMLSTIPPRANGGNMDNPYLTEGTTVYFPVFVPGALFSIGDTHAAQGMGEVCGTGIEAPMTIVLELRVIKGGRKIAEPEYETDAFYAVTAFGTTLDAAAKKATRYMIDYLVQEHGLTPTEAYVLCSLAGELQIAEVVDVPHVLVAMHMPKAVLSGPV